MVSGCHSLALSSLGLACQQLSSWDAQQEDADRTEWSENGPWDQKANHLPATTVEEAGQLLRGGCLEAWSSGVRTVGGGGRGPRQWPSWAGLRTEWYWASERNWESNHSRGREWKWNGQRGQGVRVTRAKDKDAPKAHLNITARGNCHFQVIPGYC